MCATTNKKTKNKRQKNKKSQNQQKKNKKHRALRLVINTFTQYSKELSRQQTQKAQNKAGKKRC